MTLSECNPIWYVTDVIFCFWVRFEFDDGVCDATLDFWILVALCESARVQRDLQFEEQVGQGPRCVWRIRRGSVFSLLHQIRRCEAQAGRAQPDVLPIVDSQDARPDTGTG